jgi:hypothetical protein
MGENFAIEYSLNLDALNVMGILQVPYIKSGFLGQTPYARTQGGLIGFDIDTRKMWQQTNQGPGWIPIGGGSSGAGMTIDYSLKKSASQSITSGLYTTLGSWSAATPYFDNTNLWNLGSGVYQADIPHFLMINANVAWQGGITNQGRRTLQVIYKPLAQPEQILKEVSTQADADLNEETTQECSTGASLGTGDQIYVKVYQDSGLAINISSQSTLAGHRTNP